MTSSRAGTITEIRAVFPENFRIQRTGRLMEEHWRGITNDGSRPIRYEIRVSPPGMLKEEDEKVISTVLIPSLITGGEIYVNNKRYLQKRK